ncbi:hypothetical protein EON67_11340, partial [archaeon]
MKRRSSEAHLERVRTDLCSASRKGGRDSDGGYKTATCVRPLECTPATVPRRPPVLCSPSAAARRRCLPHKRAAPPLTPSP